MKLDGRRESTHVEDRRGMSTKSKAGLGIGGTLIVVVLALLFGGNPSQVLQQVAGSSSQVITENTNLEFTPEEQELASFAKKVFAGTEDVWTSLFKQMGRTYEPPTLVLYSGAVSSGCGNATSESGPFYCSADQKVYIDLDFFMTMKQQIGADGDFAYAYVIAHEVGHHVQYLLGTLSQAHQKMARVGQAESNQISVRLELQADFYAGVWAYHDNQMFGSLEEGDIQEALDAASKIGDDYLQKKARGYAVPESFNHGTSAQRYKWLRKGLTTGDVRNGDTFSPAYASL